MPSINPNDSKKISDKDFRERHELTPALLCEKQECYLCAMQPLSTTSLYLKRVDVNLLNFFDPLGLAEILPLAEDRDGREEAVLGVVHLHLGHPATELEESLVIEAGLLVVVAGERVVGGEDDAVALNVVPPRGSDHHDLAGAGLEQDHLIGAVEGLKPGQVATELDNELHGEDGDLGDVTEQTFRLVDVGADAVERHVVDLLQVLLSGLLELFLEVDQTVDQLLLLGL